MKQANIILKLDKNGFEVPMTGVTPVEVLLLVSDHHRNAGGNPITVDEKSVKETGYQKQVGEEEKEVTVDIKQPDGSYQRVKEKRKEPKYEFVPDKRTVDDECNRLRGKYGEDKVDNMLTKIRDIPTDDFKKAIEIGVRLKSPKDNEKRGVVSEVTL